MTVVFVVVITHLVQIVPVSQMVVTLQIIVALVILTHPMTVYRIVVVRGVAGQHPNAVKFARRHNPVSLGFRWVAVFSAFLDKLFFRLGPLFKPLRSLPAMRTRRGRGVEDYKKWIIAKALTRWVIAPLF